MSDLGVLLFALVGGVGLGALILVQHRMRQRGQHAATVLLALTEHPLKTLGREPKEGLLPLRARTNASEESVFTDTVGVAGHLRVLGEMPSGTHRRPGHGAKKIVQVILEEHRVPGLWHTKRGTPIELAADHRLLSYPNAPFADADLLALPKALREELPDAFYDDPSEIQIREHIVEEGDEVLIWGKHSRTAEGFRIEPRRAGGVIHVLCGDREALAAELREISNPHGALASDLSEIRLRR